MRSVCRAISHYATSASTTNSHLVRSTTFALHSSYSTVTSTASKTKSKPFQNSRPFPSSSLPRTTGDGSVDAERPRPREVPFQPKVANSVNLIGHVHIPVEFQTTPDGKTWAATVLTWENPSDSTSLWIPIIFEGDLAHIAAFHLKEKDCVHISGELSADLSHLEIHDRGKFQIIVRTLNFVQGYPCKKNISDIFKQKEASYSAAVKNKQESWRDLIDNPEDWRDYRSDKINNSVKPKHPDFKRKDGSVALWLDSAPQWVQVKFKGKEFDVQTSNTKQGSKSVAKNGDDCWRDLINNPKQWRDYRSDKLNNLVNHKHPDFKCKDQSIQLWLNRAPQWVHPKLEGKKFDAQTSYTKQENGSDVSWKDLVENPKNWWDNRSNKRTMRAPDFRHKETGAVLWLNDSPSWVLAKLPPLKSC